MFSNFYLFFSLNDFRRDILKVLEDEMLLPFYFPSTHSNRTQLATICFKHGKDFIYGPIAILHEGDNRGLGISPWVYSMRST